MPNAATTVEERQVDTKALKGAVAPTVTNAIFEGLDMTMLEMKGGGGRDDPAIRGVNDTWTRVPIGFCQAQFDFNELQRPKIKLEFHPIQHPETQVFARVCASLVLVRASLLIQILC